MTSDETSGLIYDYDEPRAFAAELGLTWSDDTMRVADGVFASADMTQGQVTAVTRLFVWLQAWQWNPSNYPFRVRLRLAWHFLTYRKGA